MASKDLNVVSIVGRLTRNSELRIANNGTPVSNFSIAVNRRRKNGEIWEDETNFFDVVFMGKGAERINMYLEKGRQIAVQGELHQRRWESEQGPRQSVEIWAQEIQLLAQSQMSQTAPSSGMPQSFSQNQQYNRPSYGQNTGYAPQSPVQGMPGDVYQGSNANQNSVPTNPSADFAKEPSKGPESFEDDDFPF